MSAPGFWEDKGRSAKVLEEAKALKAAVKPYDEMTAALADAGELAGMAADEGDAATLGGIEREFPDLSRRLDAYELQALLSEPHDARGAFVDIHAGAGGTEACDWASMLVRMYTRWAEGHGYRVRVMDLLDGDEAGIRSCTLQVEGAWAYGRLKAERGVHRLVRISPYDANKRRHTTFASVDILPVLDEEADIVINDKDLRVDTYRSGGAGGQHVNKTESAVRITHLPTGVVVACQNERSQHANRKMAMTILYARLVQLEVDKQSAEVQRLYGEKGEIAWGHQIRSYVMQPYVMVKDHRTDHQTSDAQGVLDGDLDAFIDAYLRARTQDPKRKP